MDSRLAHILSQSTDITPDDLTGNEDVDNANFNDIYSDHEIPSVLEELRAKSPYDNLPQNLCLLRTAWWRLKMDEPLHPDLKLWVSNRLAMALNAFENGDKCVKRDFFGKRDHHNKIVKDTLNNKTEKAVWLLDSTVARLVEKYVNLGFSAKTKKTAAQKRYGYLNLSMHQLNSTYDLKESDKLRVCDIKAAYKRTYSKKTTVNQRTFEKSINYTDARARHLESEVHQTIEAYKSLGFTEAETHRDFAGQYPSAVFLAEIEWQLDSYTSAAKTWWLEVNGTKKPNFRLIYENFDIELERSIMED